MIPDTNGKPESRRADADELAKLLEIELLQKKAEWGAATERYRTMRTVSFFFLALVIMGAVAALFYLLLNPPTPPPKQPSPAASASP